MAQMDDNVFQEVNGCCPYCGSTVNIIEGLVFDYNLDKDGYPEDLNEDHYKITGYCRNCYMQLFPVPNGDGTFRMYPTMVKDTFERYRAMCDNDVKLSNFVVNGIASHNPFSDPTPITDPEVIEAGREVVEAQIEVDDVPW